MSTARRGRSYVALAAVAWSSAGLFQRELSVSTATQVAGRAVFAAVGLFAYVALSERGAVGRAFRAIGRGGIAIVILLALSSGSFLVALNHASVANVLFFQALAPILAAAMGSFLGDPVSRRTWAPRNWSGRNSTSRSAGMAETTSAALADVQQTSASALTSALVFT